MRTKANQPRKGKPGSGGGSSSGGAGAGGGKGGSPLAVLRSLSAGMGLADMAKWAAEQAAEAAAAAAKAAGATATQMANAAKHARAESIRSTASRAGVSTQTARRWARGAQRPAAGTEKATRQKMQRSLGGARGLQAARMRGVTGMRAGNVTVMIKSGPTAGTTERRTIGSVSIPRSTSEEIARLLAEGEDVTAEELLSDAVLDAYGPGLSGIMRIVSFDDPTSWL
ncbi:hypothetical protein ACFWO6_30765 [Paenibacillus glucanolyticus]|uniref:hypothetical protein n=1 Tax=Paenibacillus glucanolyticus TaxID=59843 RepID=UPI00364A9270